MIRAASTFLLAYGCMVFAQAPQVPPPPKSIAQISQGRCSPNIVNSGNGPVTIQFVGGACADIDPEAVQRLNEFLAEYPKVQSRLLELLDQKDATIQDKVKEIDKWALKYGNLAKLLAKQGTDDEASRRAKTFLLEGDLDAAAAVYDQLIALDKANMDRAASHQFSRAGIAELQHKPDEALAHYDQAFRLSPREFDYAYRYGELLSRRSNLAAAEPVLRSAAQIARDSTNPLNLGKARFELGLLYTVSRRREEAYEALSEALAIYRKLARDDPATYLPELAAKLHLAANYRRGSADIAGAATAYSEALAAYAQLAEDKPLPTLAIVKLILQSLSTLDDSKFSSDARSEKQVENAYTDALAICRRIAATFNARPAFTIDSANILERLGALYDVTRRQEAAESAYTEALAIWRQLAKDDPAANIPDLSRTLNRLGILYARTKRPQEAERAFSEAEEMCRQPENGYMAAYYSSRLGVVPVGQSESANAAPFLGARADALNNLGVLYMSIQRRKEAEPVFSEALSIYRQLAKDNPARHLPHLVGTLSNLGGLYRVTQRPAEAEAAYSEAISDLRKLVKLDAPVYGDRLAISLLESVSFTACELLEGASVSAPCLQSPAVCERLEEAARVAVSNKVKEGLAFLVQKSCPTTNARPISK